MPVSFDAQQGGKVDFTDMDPQDPFVRGLKRLDERLRLQRKSEEAAARALKMQEEAARRAAEGEDDPSVGLVSNGEIIIPAPISDPDFFTAFAARKYRLDGMVLSRPADRPTIHIYEEKVKQKASALYWSGSERRWVYQRQADEKIADIAKKLIMKPADLLGMNNVLRESQLRDPLRLYVSPRDNGPLIHIVRRGDSLSKLAKAYDTDAARLRVRNRLDAKASLIIGQRFLVREKAINTKLARLAVPEPTEEDVMKLSMARQPYARLGQYGNKPAAMRGAREFYRRYFDFMDSDIVLRRERDESQKNKSFYNMDIGPLRSAEHGEAYCALFRKDDMPCLVVERVPGPERVRNFDSQAIISVSPYAYYDEGDALDPGTTDVEKLTKLEYFLTEGQSLGDGEGVIAKITDDRIMLTDTNGYLLTLPLNKVPEVDPIEKAKKEAAARQAALNQAAAAAGSAAGAAGGVDVDAPGVEDLGVAQRLKEKEAQRRQGSGNFIKDLAAKPKRLDEKD
jgi:nucleoid-associated protein YgaU